MPAAQKWLTEIYENSAEGVSSAVTPELLPPSQLAWGKNIRTRGAKPGTRPSLKYMGTLPSGLVQGVSYFGVQGGMGVISIGGHIYRLRIGLNSATFEEIALPWFNSGIIKQVYMQQTVETLVIQDGQSNPILYDGSTAERSVPEDGGVPLGRQMAYGNGRLWVAINGKELVAGDIRSNVIGSELLFTETNYLSSGGTFFFPKGITGLNFIATTGTSDYGALLIFGNDTCDALRADITYRDLWAQTPGFITSVLRHTGCASHWSLAQVNQDLYWRDSAGGIRSIRSSLADESGAGNAPISREVSRLTDYDSQKLLPFCSTISFNNRLLMTSSPRLNKRGGITWGSLISLDFAPISTMRGKSFPSYDGQWDGINFTHLFQGQFNGRSRAFAVTLNDDNSNSLWEIMADGRGAIGDETIECSDGSSTNGITCSVEYGRRSFGINGVRKRLERCDVYLWAMRGDVDLSVYWRADNNQKWQSWGDAVEVCAKDGDPEVPGASTHVWRNLLPQQRPQIKTFTIPSNIDDITKYSLANGYEFQIRLVWTGQVHIYKTILHSTMLDDPAWAMRDLLTASCLYNDVSGNQVTYKVPVSPCPILPCNPTFTNECRTRGGVAELCGQSEFADPSVPPKKYRTKTLSGHGGNVAYSAGNTTCNDAAIGTYCNVRLDWSGVNSWDAETCAYTQGGIQDRSGTCGGNGPISAENVNAFAPDGSVMVSTKTTSVYTCVGTCIVTGFGTGSIHCDSTGDGRMDLTDEDTEDDAIARLLAAEDWSAWSEEEECLAGYEERVSGFTFNYTIAQRRITATGATIGVLVTAEVPIYRRVYGIGDYELYQTITLTETANGVGTAVFEFDVPNDQGFETYAGTPVVTAPSCQ